MDMWIALAVGVFLGAGLSYLGFMLAIGKWYVGDLREDRSDGSEQPYYFMEIAKGGMAHVQTNRFVLLRVNRENYVKEE